MNTFTRSQYMKNECTHREYYGQFVTPANKKDVLNMTTLKTLLKCKEDNLSEIPLRNWDGLSVYVTSEQFKQAGDSYSLSFLVCVNKEAAKQIIDDNT